MDIVYLSRLVNGVEFPQILPTEHFSGVELKNNLTGEILNLDESDEFHAGCFKQLFGKNIFRKCTDDPSLLLQSESIPYPSGYHTPRNIYIFFTTISDEHFRDQLLERGIRITAGCFDSNHVLDQFRGLRMDYPKDLRDPDRVIDVH
jgi:hypothetical protein